MADEIIRSASNLLVRRLRRLKEKAAGELCLLEGPTLLEEALAAGMLVAEVAVTPRFARTGRGARLLEELGGRRVRYVEERILSSLSEMETSQGVVALARRPTFEENELFRGKTLLVVAVGIQSPGNLGGLLRTAEAAGATGAFLTEGTADPFAWKALRGSMGSAFRLPHLRHLRVEQALATLRARSVRTLATVSDAAGTAYEAADLSGPLALLLGSEGAGLPEAVVKAADLRVTIPLSGGAQSLNVGVAAGIILFEAARQRR